jgi:beta-carotene/zeaxanthin 4-ketolase
MAVGLLIAIALVGCWGVSLLMLLPFDLAGVSSLGLMAMILGRTFLQTGLFVLAHDAMHGSLVPGRPGVNGAIGRILLCLYGFLPYRECAINHAKHHRYPGEGRDPDFHDGVHCHPIAWYIKFMGEYLLPQQWPRLLGLWVGFIVALYCFNQGHILNGLLFVLLPLGLSSIQLFYFGTYLPHRGDWDGLDSGLENVHHAKTIPYPVVCSFITCYHFGYHWEHHEYPDVPWYRLPAVHLYQRQNHKIDYVNANE